ncbi:MAG: hypothetical protein JSW07_17485 [bacterium]|nr:MAG: hypothetical protein JSW07_17485 [bacterium]
MDIMDIKDLPKIEGDQVTFTIPSFSHILQAKEKVIYENYMQSKLMPKIILKVSFRKSVAQLKSGIFY